MWKPLQKRHSNFPSEEQTSVFHFVQTIVNSITSFYGQLSLPIISSNTKRLTLAMQGSYSNGTRTRVPDKNTNFMTIIRISVGKIIS